MRFYVKLLCSTTIKDHEALKCLQKYKESTGQLALSQLQLLEFNFKIKGREVGKHQAVDALSYLEIKGYDTATIEDDISRNYALMQSHEREAPTSY